MYVCLCRGVSDRAISRAITEGACTVEQVAACTGAGTKCGRCRPEVAEMILASAAPESRTSLPMLRDDVAA